MLLQPETHVPESIHLPCLFHVARKMTRNCMLMNSPRHPAQVFGSHLFSYLGELMRFFDRHDGVRPELGRR